MIKQMVRKYLRMQALSFKMPDAYNRGGFRTQCQVGINHHDRRKTRVDYFLEQFNGGAPPISSLYLTVCASVKCMGNTSVTLPIEVYALRSTRL